MNISRFFYKLYSVDRKNDELSYLWTGFPIGRNGNLLTCRQVVERTRADRYLEVFDNEMQRLIPLTSPPTYPTNPEIDLAFLRNSFGRHKEELFPIMRSTTLNIGEDVYSFGYFSIGGDQNSIEQGYSLGGIINFFR